MEIVHFQFTTKSEPGFLDYAEVCTGIYLICGLFGLGD